MPTVTWPDADELDPAVPLAVDVLELGVVLLELHAAASDTAAASTTVPARRLLSLMTLLGVGISLALRQVGGGFHQPLPDGTAGELVVAQRLLAERRGEARRGRRQVAAGGDAHRVGEM